MIYSSYFYDNLPEDLREKNQNTKCQYALLPVFLSQNYIMVMLYQCLVLFNELLWSSVCFIYVQNDPEVLSNRTLTRYIKRTRRSRKQCSILSIPFWDLFWERDVTGQSITNPSEVPPYMTRLTGNCRGRRCRAIDRSFTLKLYDRIAPFVTYQLDNQSFIDSQI